MHSAVVNVRGLYGITDADASGDPVRLAQQLLDGGCRLIQLRAKSWSKVDIERAAWDIKERCQRVRATLIINDHIDIAKAIDADGVHVGQEDIRPEEARKVLGKDKIIGCSSHTLEQHNQAGELADYVALGPIFPSHHKSKPSLGVDGLQAILQSRQHQKPVVVIGGIHAEHVHTFQAMGVAAWAVIGAIATTPDPVAATRQFVAEAHL